MEKFELLVNGAAGVYVPQSFVENFNMSAWEGIKPADIEILRAGPDHPDYWYAWEDILDNAKIEVKGKTFGLYQDGDLRAVCYDEMTEQDWEENFGI